VKINKAAPEILGLSYNQIDVDEFFKIMKKYVEIQ
jgi:hypothetical protein